MRILLVSDLHYTLRQLEWVVRSAPSFDVVVLAGDQLDMSAWADRIDATRVFNAGRQIGPVPCHVDIELASGTASWRSLMGSESLSLTAQRAPERSLF